QKEVRRLEKEIGRLKEKTYAHLTPWQRVQIARHPKRPYTADYIRMIFKNFVELSGDRAYADDKAVIGGFATIDGRSCLVLGHQKGRDAKDNIYRNFGSAHPEGYRKAMRLMKLAEKFGLPIVTMVDTPGAYPGIGAEERGQANMIAYNLREMVGLRVPVVVVVIGEGGSGGAIGIGVGDRVFVLENAYYSVISPEGCAAILWKDYTRAPEAASALKLTARDLVELGVIDGMIKEPMGGAHYDPEAAAQEIKRTVLKCFDELGALQVETLTAQRYEKFRKMGEVLSAV
ncbi:MAG: acetyl-CoA carboxylase carboxyltransferase subunit alpha, partial [Candidatus Omnitrophica bacterium]|nr:acetyl-CoA carboxylase carboxyltransferase subunit alpha [Candidatus Omnitrophota bacterium]